MKPHLELLESRNSPSAWSAAMTGFVQPYVNNVLIQEEQAYQQQIGQYVAAPNDPSSVLKFYGVAANQQSQYLNPGTNGANYGQIGTFNDALHTDVNLFAEVVIYLYSNGYFDATDDATAISVWEQLNQYQNTADTYLFAYAVAFGNAQQQQQDQTTTVG